MNFEHFHLMQCVSFQYVDLIELSTQNFFTIRIGNLLKYNPPPPPQIKKSCFVIGLKLSQNYDQPLPLVSMT